MAALTQRPQLHFSAEKGWINDPNGLCCFRGQYHLFFQYNPYSTDWMKMHWGHAVSDDLVTWKELPIALTPDEWYEDDEKGGCFSGSAYVEDDVMYLFYTAVANGVSRQCIASSQDGITFTKHGVIIEPPEGYEKDFRDPKVFRKGEHLFMVLGASNGTDNVILLYEAEDLFHWKYKSVLYTVPEEVGKMPECPDLIEFKDNNWVLTFSPMYYGKKGSTSSAILGTFNPKAGVFRQEYIMELDSGTDFYASQSFLDEKGRRICIAWNGQWPWMSFFSGYGETAHEGWRGFMSLPRLLTYDQGIVKKKPVENIDKLFGKPRYGGGFRLDEYRRSYDIFHSVPAVCKVELSIDNLDIEHTEGVIIEYGKLRYLIDYTKWTVTLTDERNEHVKQTVTPTFGMSKNLKFTIYFDHCSIESFIYDDIAAISHNDYERDDDTHLVIHSIEGAVWVYYNFYPLLDR